MRRKNTPNFIGIGVMKSATTWLSQCLREHPMIYLSDIKELHYFSNNYHLGIDWYLGHFKDTDKYKGIGEFSVSYFDDNKYLELIKKDLGEVKILINLRDPVTRFLSHLKHIYRIENLRKEDIKYQVDIEFLNHITQKFPSLLHKGIYYPTIKYCQELFGSENVLVTTKEEIDENPKKVLKNIFNFLEVDQNFEPTILNKSVSKGIIPKNTIVEKGRVFLYRLSKKYFPKLILFTRKYRIGEVYRKVNDNHTRISLDLEAYEYLRKYYSNDLYLLNTKTPINTLKWKNYE